MFNIQRTGTAWGAHLKKAAVAALLVAGAGAASAATVPVSLCAAAGNTGASGLPANTVVYGYGSTCGAPTMPGGPTIVVNVGDVVTVTLTNNLTVPTGLMFQGQALPFDGTGAAAGGGTKSYTFTASQPGTYLYEAAPIPGTEYQVAMGLYGALVVRPSVATQAYDSTASAFDNEAVLVLSELDPALNSSAAPASFDMRKYAPKYFLINGKPYPKTDPLPSTGTYAAGSKLALRYLNAGAKIHSMGVLGLRQVFVAKDGNLLPQANHNVVAESIAPGQTADAIVTIPAALTAPAKFAVYDASLSLHNNGSFNGFGGMLAFLSAGAGTSTGGPVVSTMAYTSPTLTATIDATSLRTVTAYQYWFGSGGGVTDVTVTTPAASVSVSRNVVAPTLNGTIYLRGKDDQGNWGATRTVAFAGDTTGPAVTAQALLPNPATPTSTIALSATATDTQSNVIAAEYRINGGASVAATLGGSAALSRSVSASISGLAAGSYNVDVRAQDAVGNWGAWAPTAQLVVSAAQLPVTSGVSASPNPNNGSIPLSATQPVVRVSATGTAVGGGIVAAEGFIDPVGTPAITTRGFPFVPADGAWGGGTESVYADIPLTTIAALSTGSHPISVRVKDALGNWSALVNVTLLIDKVAPTFTALTTTLNTPFSPSTVTLGFTSAADTGGAGIAGGEYWINPPTTTAPAVGQGTAFTGTSPTINVAAFTAGSYTVSARLRDAAGNWSTVGSATFSVLPESIFVNGFDTGSRPWGWSSASTNTASRLNVTTTGVQGGTQALQAQGNNTNYVQFDFNTPANPASGTVDARFYFNPNNNAGTGQDIFEGLTGNNNPNPVYRVRYRRNNAQPQVQLQVGNTANASWVNITNNAYNRIETTWTANGTLVLYVNGASSQTLTANANTVNHFRLGSVTAGTSNTLMYFDTFAAKRSTTPLVVP